MEIVFSRQSDPRSKAWRPDPPGIVRRSAYRRTAIRRSIVSEQAPPLIIMGQCQGSSYKSPADAGSRGAGARRPQPTPCPPASPSPTCHRPLNARGPSLGFLFGLITGAWRSTDDAGQTRYPRYFLLPPATLNKESHVLQLFTIQSPSGVPSGRSIPFQCLDLCRASI